MGDVTKQKEDQEQTKAKNARKSKRKHEEQKKINDGMKK